MITDYLDTILHPNISRFIYLVLVLLGIYIIFLSIKPLTTDISDIKKSGASIITQIDMLEDTDKMIKHDVDNLGVLMKKAISDSTTGKGDITSLNSKLARVGAKIKTVESKTTGLDDVFENAKNSRWINIGGWKDTPDRALPTLLGENFTSPAQCVQAAATKGMNCAAMQNGRQCWACKNCNYSKYGGVNAVSSNGAAWVNNVWVNLSTFGLQ